MEGEGRGRGEERGGRREGGAGAGEREGGMRVKLNAFSKPLLESNSICGNGYGVWVREESRGVIQNNKIEVASLRTRYAMSGTARGCAVNMLRSCSAMSGTDLRDLSLPGELSAGAAVE
eukprot:2648062-Rhodomonas_salina.1